MRDEAWLPNENDVQFFNQNGYWISPKIISDERLETLRDHLEKVFRGEFETGKEPWHWGGVPPKQSLHQANNAHWADMTFRSLATDSVIGEIAAKLMGATAIRLWHDQLLLKPGNAGSNAANVGWHQDYFYWQCAESPTMLTAWVAFDDVTVQNGCMQVVPGSNTWGLVNVNDFFDPDLDSQQSRMHIPQGKDFKPYPLEMKAGQVSFHHCFTLHGSGPNHTDRPRRSYVIHLMTGDTRYKAGSPSDEHMNVKLANPNDGDLFQGEWFPTLYQSS